jgi:hypothetical protein
VSSVIEPSQAHQSHVSTLSGQGINPYPASYTHATDEGFGRAARVFLLPFGCPAFASWVSYTR